MPMLLGFGRNACGLLSALGLLLVMAVPPAVASPEIDQIETCDVLVVGGGLAGVATAYESLHAGRTVCLT